MSSLQETLLPLLDVLKTSGLSPSQTTAPPRLEEWTAQVRSLRPSFLEWDEDRGMYYLDFGLPGSRGVTTDFTVYRLQTPRVSDIYRFESNRDGELTGLEFQTQAPGPLPFLRDHYSLAGLSAAPECLSPQDWESYLRAFLTGV